MRRPNGFSSLSLILGALLISVLALVFSCDQQPSMVLENEVAGDLSGSGTIDPGAVGAVLLGSVSDTALAPGYIEVWAMNVVFHPDDGMVTFDVALVNRSRRAIPPPINFAVVYVAPRDIAVVEFDGVTPDGFPFYDFSDAIGEDKILSPGERTAPVELKFHTVSPRSFAIGFRIDIGPWGGDGVIGGVVFRDDNHNGLRDRCEPGERCEPGIPGITVALEKPLYGGDYVTLLTRTDANGEYRFGVLREGAYKVFVAAPEDAWEVTSANPLLVTLIKGPDGRVQNFLGAHFGLFPLMPPIPDNLFGPILVGPMSPFGTLVDSTFVNPPSMLPVVYSYYLDVAEPPFEWPMPNIVDSAAAWINGEMVFSYRRPAVTDTLFLPQTIKIREGLVETGENTIRLFTDGNEYSALTWRMYRKP